MTTQLPPRRRTNLRAALLTALTVGFCIVTLLGIERFAPLPNAVNDLLGNVSRVLVQLVTIVAALAVFLGVLNLLRVHSRKLRRFPQALYSLSLILSLFAVVVLHFLERFGTLRTTDALGAPSATPAVSITLLNTLQVAVETALASLLFFTLVYAAFRMLRQRTTVWNVLFIAAVAVVLIGFSPVPSLSLFSTIREWLISVPVSAGTRGLLIGVGLGVLVVGVRVLTGRDRGFRE